MCFKACIAVVYIVFSLALTTECTQLFINNTVVIENKEVNFTCSSPDSSMYSSWTLDNSLLFHLANNATGHCFPQGKDESFVRCYHYDNTYILTYSPRRDQHGNIWSCKINEIFSNTIILNVSVPVSNVTLGQDDHSTVVLKENVDTELTCTTSYCRPRANIIWYIERNSQSTPIYFNETKTVCSYINETLDLVSTNCTIRINLKRTYNNWNLVCAAENIIHYKPVVSGYVSLNITYPTNKPIINCTNNGTYKIIQNTIGKLTCSVDGGNPAGSLHWNCSGSTSEHQVHLNNVTKTVVWNATNTQYCTCNATNIAGTRATSVKTEILSPPVIHEMHKKTIIEGDSLTLHCDIARANPPVYMIRWTSNKHNVPEAKLTLTNVSRRDDMVYTCTANNTMDPSCQDVVQGSTSKSLHVEVLYPPFVNITKENTYTVKEGDRFNYTCPVVPGNPSRTNITWKRSNDTKTWSSAELTLNITRYDDSIYTCYATNVMVSSNGINRTGNVSEDIRLIVQFQASVTDFYIQGYGHNTSVIVMENTSLEFVCRLQSNPTADVRIQKVKTEVESSKTNVLFYYTNASCLGAVVNYSCHGNNFMNNISSTRQIGLIVKCKPRADTNMFVEYVAINQNVTLSYTALAYPHPSFTWYRNGSSIITSDPHNIESSSNLQTNLSITNVEESDFGVYYLNVSNNLGYITELFQLKPKGVPEVPNNLTQNGTATTDSIIALNWRPGFNNGLVQTFTLLYSNQTEGNWLNATVHDTGAKGTTIHYNITGLAYNTKYDIVLFAINAMGRSKRNVTMTCKTNAPVSQPAHNSSALIGAVAGSVSGIILIGVAIVVVIFRRRVQNKQHSDQISPEPASLYANVKNEIKPLVNQESNPVVPDRGIYENAEIGTTKNQRQTSNGENLTLSGVYANVSNRKGTEKRMTKKEEFPMQTIMPDIKASDVSPLVPANTRFESILCKVDGDDDQCDQCVCLDDGNIYSNSTEEIERIENLFVHELFAFVAGKSLESFATEFRILPKDLIMPCAVAVKPENIKLNRYNGIFPYDHSRVTIPDDPAFFMNACYIDGYKRDKSYIASLGPTADTSSGFKTFWKMVWYEQSDIIVMVTNLREITGMKCEQYWPTFGSSKVYGEVTVTCRNVEEYAEYTVRTFNLSDSKQSRMLTQLHFTAWPDKRVPDDLTSLLEFLQRMKFTPSHRIGPIIVHCSAGIGRTGTLIALDRLIAEGKETNSINVSSCVRGMRQQRVNMVQTQEQYVYIYKACVYALAMECKCVSAAIFNDELQATTDAQFGELFMKLKATVDNESVDEKKAILNNKHAKSNRPNADISGDRYRVRLYVDKESDVSDYTNAVYINSFKTKNRFIAAQTPMKDFVQDFICMVFQEQCICVVDIDGNLPVKLDVGVYIPPANQSSTLGNFTISCEKLDSNPKYTVTKMKIENTGKFYKGEWTSYHFKFNEWKHGKDTPTDPKDFIEFVKEVDDYAKQFGEKVAHVLVHCLDASTKSGLFCFVACLLEKIQCERQVNIGNTLRQVRTRRKTTIKNANQLKFCYKAVNAFIEMNKAK